MQSRAIDEKRRTRGAALNVRLKDRPHDQAGQFSLGTFAPGTYRVDVLPAISSTLVHLAAGQRQEVVLDAAAQRQLRVFVLDGDSAQVLASAFVHARLGSAPSGVWTPLRFDVSAGCHVGPIGLGDVQVLADLESHGNALLDVADTAVANGVTIRLRPVTRYAIRVLVEDGGSGIVVPPSAWSTSKIVPVEPCRGKALRISFSRMGEGRNVRNYVEWQVDQPGRYEITLPRFPGYEPVENRLVVVGAEAIPPIVVQLTPAIPREGEGR